MLNKLILFIFLFWSSLFSFSQSSLDSLRMVLPVGHNSRVTDAVYNSEYSKLYSVGWDKKMIIWDVKRGRELITCSGHTDYIDCIDISSDDLKIATGGWDKTVRIWDANDGSLLKILQGHSESVTEVFFFKKNNNRVISVSDNGGIFVWDINKGEILFEFNGSILAINNNEDLIFVNELDNVFVKEEDKNIIATSYSLITGKKVNNYRINETLDYESLKLVSLSIDESKKLLIAIGCNTLPIVWDIESTILVNSFQGNNCDDSFSGELSPDNNYILIQKGTDGIIDLLSANTGKLLYSDIDSSTNVENVFFSSDAKHIVLYRSTGYRDGKSEARIKVISMSNFEKTAEIEVEDINYWSSSLINLYSNKFFSFIGDDKVYLYEFETGRLVNKINIKGTSMNAVINSKSGGFNKNLSSLENYIGGYMESALHLDFSLGCYDFMFNISDPHLIYFLQNKLISISHNYQNGFLLNDTSILEVQIPEFKIVNNSIFEISNEVYNEELLTNLQLSEKYLFVEYNDSIHVYKRDGNVLIKKVAGQNLSLSNIDDIIGFTSAGESWEVNNTLVYNFISEDTLFFKENSNYVNEICFGPNSDYFLTRSSYMAYDDEAILYDLESNCIIDTINTVTPNAGFTIDGSQVLYEQYMFHENRNKLKTIIRDFSNHEDIGELRGINPQVDWTNKYYSTISNDTIIIYRTDDFSYVKSLIGHKEEVRNVVFNSEINKLVSSGFDNQIIIWDFEKGKEIYRLLVLRNNNWLISISNSPYYMCSKDASKMLHYVTPSLKVIGFDQLDPVYNRPDIVLDSIGKYFGGADQRLVQQYKQAWEKRVDRLGLDKEMLATGDVAVPDAVISNEEELAYENTVGFVAVDIIANDPKYKLKRYNVYVNEVPIYGSNGVSITDLNLNEWDTTLHVPLSIGENKIQVSVMNELGLQNFKYPTYVNYVPKEEIVSKTYYVGIGVNDFEDPKASDLRFCVNDVKGLAEGFFKMGNTDTLLLTNAEVTVSNVKEIKNYLLKNVTVNDRVIISCSSHGLLDGKNQFYLAMHNTNFSDPSLNGLPYEELERLLDSIPARRKLLMIDACNSGENEIQENEERILAFTEGQDEKARGITIESLVEEQKSTFETMMELFVNVQNESGTVIISAAGGKQSALEAIKVDGKVIQNGAFTYCVMEYLSQDGELTVNGLKNYVESRVVEITEGKQQPTSRQETMEVDWLLK